MGVWRFFFFSIIVMIKILLVKLMMNIIRGSFMVMIVYFNEGFV